jgi:MOSC domain-containing protein YiiM
MNRLSQSTANTTVAHDSPDLGAAAVLSIQVGTIAPLGPDGVPSGFVKRPVAGPVHVGVLNIDGDVQADLSVHGGLDKAVYGYSAANYARWLEDFPEHRSILAPGVFGENLTIVGLTEADIRVGDVHAIGSVQLQVTQPRQPCFKFALRMGDARMPAAMVRSGRSGWYYRVLEEGILTVGDTVRLIDRPNPDLLFTRLVEIVYRRRVDEGELARLADAVGLADWLRVAARRSLRDKLQRLRP